MSFALDELPRKPYGATVLSPEGVTPDRCGSHTAPSWHVAQTHPQAERWAATCLAEQGFATYLPLCTVIRQDRVTRTMTRPVQVPLWPRYVLVRFALTDPWGPVQHTRGVAALLMDQPGKPGTVPDGLVEALQAGEAARRTVGAPDAPWHPGAPCRLAGGAFAGHDAVVLTVGRDVATVALVIFGALRQAIVGLPLLTTRDCLK
jgi:transcription antitermination factor NusG